jgi:hypothetical protein
MTNYLENPNEPTDDVKNPNETTNYLENPNEPANDGIDGKEPHEPTNEVDRVSVDSSDDESVDVKATKGDDEVVRVEKWDKEVLRGHDGYPKDREHLNLERIDSILYTTEAAGHLDTRRSFFLRSHRRRVTQVFFLWLHQQPKYRPVGISDSYVVGLANVVNPQESEEGPVYESARTTNLR